MGEARILNDARLDDAVLLEIVLRAGQGEGRAGGIVERDRIDVEVVGGVVGGGENRRDGAKFEVVLRIAGGGGIRVPVVGGAQVGVGAAAVPLKDRSLRDRRHGRGNGGSEER